MPGKKSMNVDVEPTVLKWAIERSGWSREELIKRLKISSNVLDGWISGEVKPTVRQLEDLANVIKRPLAVFFLPEPPKEKPMPKDYRMLPDREGKFDKKTILAIRRARRLQNISKELSENLSASLNKLTATVKLTDNPQKIAAKYRKELNFDEEKQTKLKNSYDVFNYLRDLIEDENVLVFQISMPVDDARGFTLVDDYPAVIVVNSKDLIEARIFTLMHEFGHVLLNESGISMPENALFVKKAEAVEKWCNDFATSFLLPEDIAKREFSQRKSSLTDTKTLNSLSRTYKVSKAMLLYNIHRLNFISKSQYEAVLDRYKPQIDKPKEKSKQTGFAQKADKKCLNEKGQKFVSLVSNNVEKGFITHSDALDYLSIKAKNLDKVMTKAKK